MLDPLSDHPRLSLVVAVYNVAPYIDAFFDSLIAQHGGLGQVEIIVVNDGSTDGSGEAALAWAARYPQLIQVITQTNQGVAEARNAGLALATGDWVSFPDPDDILSPDFLQQMRAAIRTPRDRALLAVTARFVFYDEATDSHRDTHPLRKQFGPQDRVCDSTELGNMLLIHTTCTFIRRADIVHHQILFDPGIRPSFEDAHFMLRVLINCPDRCVVFLAKPVYYYRKRASGTSLVDGVVADPNWYAPHLQTAYLSLLKEAQACRGHIPEFVQKSVLFSLLAKLRYLTGRYYDPAQLSAQQKAAFAAGLRQVMGYIQPQTLRSAEIPLLTRAHRQGLLAWMDPPPPQAPRLDIEKGPKGADHDILCWTVGGRDDMPVRIEVNKVALPTDAREIRASTLFEQPYAHTIRQPISLQPGQVLRVFVNDTPARVHIKGRTLGYRMTQQQIAAALSGAKRPRRPLPVRLALRLARRLSLVFFR